MNRMKPERLAEWFDQIDDCMDWITTPDVRELLQALKAEREILENCSMRNAADVDRIKELEAESSKHYDFWQKQRIQNEQLNKRIAELEAEKDRHQRTHEIVCKDYEAAALEFDEDRLADMEHTIRQHEATLQRIGELPAKYKGNAIPAEALQAELEKK